MSKVNEKQITRRTFLETAAKFVGSLAFASGKLHATARANEPDKQIDDLELLDAVRDFALDHPHPEMERFKMRFG